MGEEFLKGYAVIAEGEKDPRNLLTAFAIARVILVEFDITDHVEVRDLAQNRSDLSKNAHTGHVQHRFLLLSYIFQAASE